MALRGPEKTSDPFALGNTEQMDTTTHHFGVISKLLPRNIQTDHCKATSCSKQYSSV